MCLMQVFCMPVQLGVLDRIVLEQPPGQTHSATTPVVDLQMLNCYQMRPDYEAMRFSVTEESQETGCVKGNVKGLPHSHWKALAPPQVVFDFNFEKGKLSYHSLC